MKYITFKHKVLALPVIQSALFEVLANDSRLLRSQVTGWQKKGLLSRLRRGLYVLPPLERRIEPTPFYLASQIYGPSYVSLESALAVHNLIPEFVAATTSVSIRKTKRFQNEFGIFTYQQITPKAYSGFESWKERPNLSSLVATPEKAVVDLLYLNCHRVPEGAKGFFKQGVRFQNTQRLKRNWLLHYGKLFASKKLLKVVNQFIREVLQ